MEQQNKKHLRITVEKLNEQGNYMVTEKLETNSAYIHVINSTNFRENENKITLNATRGILVNGGKTEQILLLMSVYEKISQDLDKLIPVYLSDEGDDE